MSAIESVQRQIEARELAPSIGKLRGRALNGLIRLQEDVVRAQLYPLSVDEELVVVPSVLEKATANAVWAMRVIPVVGEILLETGKKVEFTQGVFTNSAINCVSVGGDERRHVILTFGSREINAGNASEIFKGAWQKNFTGARRNIKTLANMTPLDVIGKAYFVVDKI